jgi:hypothetical protein
MLDDMTKMDAGLDARQIVTQIDAIIPELLALRRRLTAAAPPPVESGRLTAALYGALGHGTWDEYDSLTL